jgi:uncharacterized protein with NRDE domain
MMVLYQVVPDHPIVIAANRDEYYRRSSVGPRILQENPTTWGGRDLQACGSWLGVNTSGLFVGLTNRKMSEDQLHDNDRRSRGLLCLDALRYSCSSDVVTWLSSEAADLYNPFNLIVLDTVSALWIAYDGKPDIHWLEPGLHILSNRNLNDDQSLRVQRARRLIEPVQCRPLHELVSYLKRACQDHQENVTDRDTLCMHRGVAQYGTVSCSILAIATSSLHQSLYLYAHGHPCTTEFRDYSFLFA